MRNFIAVASIIFAVSPMLAQQDAEGCKDSSVLSRMRGCRIDTCEKKSFDQAEVQVGISEDGEKRQSVEGDVEQIEYVCGSDLSMLMIARNAEAALKGAGFMIVYSGKSDSGWPAVTARKGGVWVDIHTINYVGDEPAYKQLVVRTQAMEQQMVASAEAFEQAITTTGSCSIYGIHFASGNATIQPDSESCLREVAKLLTKNSSWKMQIEGHTDNVGGSDTNLKLSQARAEAVRGWLVSHGIDGSRLVAKGFGQSKPIADNATENGRAKNRRVDLRKL